jgi:hypothetical protein
MTNKTETELRLDAWAALSALEKPLQDFKRTRKYLLNKSHLGLQKKQEGLKKKWEELEDKIKADELDNLWRSYASKMSNSFNERDFKRWLRIADSRQRNNQIESKMFSLHIQRAAEEGIKNKEEKNTTKHKQQHKQPLPPRPVLTNRYDIRYHKNNKNNDR